MKHPLFTGVCTALVTPFLDGKVNYPMMKMLLKRQIDAGVKAIVITGTTGEASTLSDNEKEELWLQAKTYAGKDCMIIAGAGSNSTAHAVELSQSAECAGADAVLSVSPYYNKANPEGLFAHYLSVAHSIRIPLILYNVPSRTGVDIPVSVYKRLSNVPNIVGVKEASNDITKITRIANACGQHFTVWSGNDDNTVAAMSMGAKGVISVISNICPAEMCAMTEAARKQEFDKARRIQQSLQKLIDLMFCEVNPIPIKAAMKCIGYDCGGCRLPLTDLSKEHFGQLQEHILASSIFR